jgi:arylsulfatase A-like enzyme
MRTLRASFVAALCVAALTATTACGKKGESPATEGGKAASGNTAPADKASAGGDAKAAVPVAPSRGPEHTVFSLIDNRLLAHAHRGGGLVVPAGSAGFAKYLRFGKSNPPWTVRDELDGHKVATLKGKAGGVTVPLTAEQAAAATTIRLRLHSAAAQRLGLRMAGKEVTAELPAGWSTAEVAVPSGALSAGENEILFFAGKSALALSWMQVGGAGFGDELAASYDPASKSLALPDGGGLAWYVMVPDGGLVTGDLGETGCKVAVRATPDAGDAVTGELVGKGSAVSLAPLGGKVARLELTASGCPSARLANAGLVVAGAAPEVKRGPAPKHVLMLIMDSLRADRIHAINPDARPETPFFDEMVGKAAVFTQFYTQGNETKCSHASIWTSQYPVNHKMIPPNSSIDLKWFTVDDLAKQAGLFASGVSANGYITPKRGFGDAWDKFRNNIHDGGGLRAEDVSAKGWESLAGHEQEPWFMYLGWIDTHVSWRAKEPWFSKYDPEPYSGRFKNEASGVDMGKVAAGQLKVDDRDKKRIIAIYDSNVSYQADQARLLVAKLDELGVLKDTMVIMTADHGDEQFEAGRVGHGGSSLDTLVWTPLIVYYPPMIPAGKVAEGAESIDIVPTIADALGQKADPAWQGESLIPLVNGVGQGYPRLSMSSKYENGHAGKMGHWKAYYAAGRGSLFDMAAEPTEKTDVSDQHPMAMRMVSDALWMLRTYNPEWKKSTWGNPANQRGQITVDLGE